MIANTDAFRTWDGNAWSLATARTHVHKDQLPAPGSGNDVFTQAELAALLPMAIVWVDPAGGFKYERESESDSGDFYPEAVLVAQFFRLPTDSEKTNGTADVALREMISDLITSGDNDNPGLVELEKPAVGFTYSGAGALAFQSFRVFGPEFSTPDYFPELGLVQHAIVEAVTL